MKHPVSTAQRQQVIALRQRHTLREVADMAGMPLGTVKTICARSGAFKDNPALRELFTLPAIQPSASTSLTVPTLPAQQVVTGDAEIDAVLWLREVIRTGQAVLIEKAMEAAKRIKTPLKELEERYSKHLVSKNPGNWTVMFATMGFADLEGLAQSAVLKSTRQHEALARFGSIEGLFKDTPAERFCTATLKGLKIKDWCYPDAPVDDRFNACPDLMPHTLNDCLYELAYWHDLYILRSANDGGDQGKDAYARECFAFRCLGRIRARSKAEAVSVFRYLAEFDRMDASETEGILLNLIGG